MNRPFMYHSLSLAIFNELEGGLNFEEVGD